MRPPLKYSPVVGRRSGGADTTSGSDGGLCVLVGYLERASDVQLRIPGM